LADATQTDVDEGARMLARHIAGEPRAFEEIVSHFGGSLYGYLARSGIERSQAEDLFQDTFMRVHMSARSYDSRYPFRVWFFTIAHNLVRSHFRKRKVRRIMTGWFRRSGGDAHADPQPLDPADDSPGPEVKTQARARVRWLAAEMQHLPAGPRNALLLTHVEGFNQSEAAKILDVPLPTVKTWVRRGRLSLVAALEARDTEHES